MDGETDLLSLFTQVLDQLGKGHFSGGSVHQHDHGEVFLQNGLADVQHIHFVVGQKGADIGDDAHSVLTDHGNDGSHSVLPLCTYFDM